MIDKVMKIEKNIPIPPRKSGLISLTLREMKVGDSIVIPKSQDTSWRTAAMRLKMDIVTRKISDTETRLWRVVKGNDES